MSAALVSVVVPAFNAAPWIENTIRSVLSQSYQDLELIIVNDGSTDDTSAIARAFTDPRLKVLDQPNRGVSAARNAGIDAAHGTYLSFLDADDAMLPDNLRLKLAALADKNVDWVYGDLMLCDADLIPTGNILAGTDGDVLSTILLGRDPAVPAPCSNVLAHRRCFDQGLRFDEELSNAADQDLTLGLARSHAYAHIPHASTYYRVLPGSMSRNIALYERDHLRLMEKARRSGLLSDPAFRRTCMANAYWSIAGSWWINAGNKWRALPFLLKALWLRPALALRPLRH